MHQRLSRAAALLLLVFVLGVSSSSGRVLAQTPAQALNPTDVIPFDPAIRTATLPNGLKYFVRRNDQPAKRISLRLVVKAGSLDEADDQQGLAHFIEHMAFNGSTHFKPGEVFSYFESIGARLGPHVNAYTSFDETVYMLDLPTDAPDIVARGLTALADFAGGLTLDPREVDKERGVVIEEWRGGLGANSRVRDKQIPILYYQSRYAERLPIGKPDVIRTAPVERLRAFYDTWYRPERMAVIAVGDVEPQQIEDSIKSTFGAVKARAAAAPLPDSAVPLHQQALVSVVTDSELTRSTVQIVRKRAKESELRVGDYRRDLVQRMVEHMFNDRLSELARKPDARFLGAGVSGGALGPGVSTFSVSAGVQDGKLEDGAAAIALEAKRVREYGFSSSELNRAKQWMAAFYERAYNERDKTESGSFAQECLDYFLEDEPTPGIAYEYALVQQVLPGIAPVDTSAMAQSLLADASRVVLAVSPQKPGIRIPTDVELQAALTSAERTAVTAWNDTTTTRELMDRKPALAAVQSRRALDNLGVTIVRFANGVEAWLKPTDFKNDQVLFMMDALGGASLAPPADFLQASLAPTYVELSGTGGLKALDLQKLLAGKLASASPFISLSTHGISGSAAPAQLETALQLLYEKFTAPGDDPDALALMKRQLQARVANRDQAPMQVFGERLEQVNKSNHFTAQPVTPDLVAALDRETMTAFYHARFSNAADFTFFMVGAFKLDQTIPLLAQYVGSLPSTGRSASQFKDLAIHFPESVQRGRVEKGREPRSQTVVSFFADPPPDPTEQENLAAATTVLDIALRDILREDLGQTYTVSVGLEQELPQRGDGHIEVSFGAAPENVQAMSERVMQEIKRLQQEGPSADLTNRAKESARRNYETALKQNGYWLRRLDSAHLLGSDPAEILRRNNRIDAVTPQVLQEVFKRYFPFDRSTIVTLVPAQSAP
jgi:zinc protease